MLVVASSLEVKDQKIKLSAIMLNQYPNLPEVGDALKRVLQVLFWDVTSTNDYFTGKISEKAKRTGQKSKEHHYGASQFSLELMERALSENITEVDIRAALGEKMTWNYTTSEENTTLRHNNQDYSKISKLVNY